MKGRRKVTTHGTPWIVVGPEQDQTYLLGVQDVIIGPRPSLRVSEDPAVRLTSIVYIDILVVLDVEIPFV